MGCKYNYATTDIPDTCMHIKLGIMNRRGRVGLIGQTDPLYGIVMAGNYSRFYTKNFQKMIVSVRSTFKIGLVDTCIFLLQVWSLILYALTGEVLIIMQVRDFTK